MLKEEYKTDPNAIEELFCKPFGELKQYQMSKDVSSLMISILMGGLDVEKLEKDKPFLYKVIEKRLEVCFDYKLDPATMLFLTALCESPGTAVMYLTYLQYWCKTNGEVKEITMKEFCDIFPMGFPSTKDLETLWDETKVHRKDMNGSDNLVDYSQAMESIRF